MVIAKKNNKHRAIKDINEAIQSLKKAKIFVAKNKFKKAKLQLGRALFFIRLALKEINRDKKRKKKHKR
jgi:hypothetical protein